MDFCVRPIKTKSNKTCTYFAEQNSLHVTDWSEWEAPFLFNLCPPSPPTFLTIKHTHTHKAITLCHTAHWHTQTLWQARGACALRLLLLLPLLPLLLRPMCACAVCCLFENSDKLDTAASGIWEGEVERLKHRAALYIVLTIFYDGNCLFSYH